MNKEVALKVLKSEKKKVEGNEGLNVCADVFSFDADGKTVTVLGKAYKLQYTKGSKELIVGVNLTEEGIKFFNDLEKEKKG